MHFFQTNLANAGRVYLMLMKRIVQHGLQYVQTETERVRGLLSGKIGTNKRWELESRLNVLKSFELRPEEKASPVFDEL